MPIRTEASTTNVIEYLDLCYHVTPEQIADALSNPENLADLKRGISLTSFQVFVGDQIAKREGWEYDDDAFTEHYTEPDEDDD